MLRRSIGFGVVAVGGIGALHAQNLARRVPGAHLVAITDLDHDRARRVGAELGVAVSGSAEELLGRRDIDAVVVASPSPTHAQLTIAAVEAGKHVLCEKPLTATLTSADEVVAAVAGAHVVVQVGFQRRHDPDWRHLAALVRNGRIGSPRVLLSSYREQEPLDGDELQDLMIHGNIHDLDAARWLMGEIDEISVLGQSLDGGAITSGAPVENLITTLRFASGAIGVIDNGTSARFGFECRAEVIGSEATLRVEDSQTPAVRELRDGLSSTSVPAESAQRFDQAYVNVMSDLCDAIRGEQQTGATAAEGRAALVLALAGERSLRTAQPVRLTHHGPSDQIQYRIAD